MALEVTITSIAEYVQNVCVLNTEAHQFGKYCDYEVLFRGQADKEYELLPTIGRNRQYSCECTIFNDERNLIEMAKFKLPDIFQNDYTPLELLALLQHYGILCMLPERR